MGWNRYKHCTFFIYELIKQPPAEWFIKGGIIATTRVLLLIVNINLQFVNSTKYYHRNLLVVLISLELKEFAQIGDFHFSNQSGDSHGSILV